MTVQNYEKYSPYIADRFMHSISYIYDALIVFSGENLRNYEFSLGLLFPTPFHVSRLYGK